MPTRALADAIAAEWEAQTERIDPATMPLTRLANSAIDGVTGREAEVRADIAKYAGSDLVCYRAEGRPNWSRRQARGVGPGSGLGARGARRVRSMSAQGIMPVIQPAPAAAQRRRGGRGAWTPSSWPPCTCMTTLTGSALLALAHARGQLTADEAWAAAHVDEDWQISQWGEDAEAEGPPRAALARDAGGEPMLTASCSAEPS